MNRFKPVLVIVLLSGSTFKTVGAFAPQDTRTYFDYHHTAADTLDKVDSQEVRENIAVVSVLATMKKDNPRQQLALPEWLK